MSVCQGHHRSRWTNNNNYIHIIMSLEIHQQVLKIEIEKRSFRGSLLNLGECTKSPLPLFGKKIQTDEAMIFLRSYQTNDNTIKIIFGLLTFSSHKGYFYSRYFHNLNSKMTTRVNIWAKFSFHRHWYLYSTLIILRIFNYVLIIINYN